MIDTSVLLFVAAVVLLLALWPYDDDSHTPQHPLYF